ncbi:MAG TPA: YceI family protein [Candidatus Limnocylindria bacterium]|jgi:polyisoprenoid-binding protein YceI|nr:YceI family protein [Candidatus Limnocylindria bacterium]
MPSRIALAVVAIGGLISCSTPQASAPALTPTPSPLATPTASAPAVPAGARRFTIVADRSLATVRVREQVAAIPAPGDAILTTRAFSGTIVLLPDGAFAGGSALAADLDTLKSDESLRDEWIKFNTLNTRVYPRAEFTLARVNGIPMPLAPQGEWTATLEGTMKIHGVERPLTWPVHVTRSAGEIRVRGATAFTFGDYGMAVPANRLILSVVDDVRLEIDLVATDG